MFTPTQWNPITLSAQDTHPGYCFASERSPLVGVWTAEVDGEVRGR